MCCHVLSATDAKDFKSKNIRNDMRFAPPIGNKTKISKQKILIRYGYDKHYEDGKIIRKENVGAKNLSPKKPI